MLAVHAADTPRTRYVVDLLFTRLLGLQVRFVPAGEDLPPDVPCVTYGMESSPEGVLRIRSCGLLEQSGLASIDPRPATVDGLLRLFPLEEHSDVPFDLLASAFYLVSRYEEYVTKERDAHGRFQPESSILYQSGSLRRPVVDQYARLLASLLERYYPRLPVRGPKIRAHSTIDVDVAYAYRGRGFARTAGAALSSPGTLVPRAKALLGLRNDPFDTYEWLLGAHEQAGVPATFFVLLREGRGVDRSLPPRSPLMRSLVHGLAEHADVGMHPSYTSNDSLPALREEHSWFSELLRRPATRSRQHYLRFDLPQTYRRLLDLGITREYSMGYASQPGFRAGTASPFPFYDLEREEETPLIVHPITYMDGTLRNHLALSADEAIRVIDELADAIRTYGGCFLPLWHNDSVAEHPPWLGWRRVFEHSLAIAASLHHS